MKSDIHFNFVHIADGMIELNWTALFEAWLRTTSIHVRLLTTWGRCMRIPGRMTQGRCDSACQLRHTSLLLLMSCCRCLLRLIAGMRLVLIETRSSVLILRAENSFRAFDAMLRLLPVSGTLVPVICIIRSTLSNRAIREG